MNDALVSDAPIRPNRMTEAEYDIERERLRGLYGNKSSEAAAKSDQALALLFERSGWTQDELAKKEGKSQDWVSLRLRFGRFLNFTTDVVKTDLPQNLTEGRFRKYWQETDKDDGKEEHRFRAVIKLITEQPELLAKREKIGAELRARFGDGKWRRVQAMAEKIDVDAAPVGDTLLGMFRSGERGRFGCKAEKRGAGEKLEYRLIKLDKMVSLAELTEKLEPLIQSLESQGKQTHSVNYHPALVLSDAKRIRKILEDLAQ